MYKLGLILLVGFLLIPKVAYPESHDDLVHATAHLGAGFTAALISDQVCNKLLKMPSNGSLLVGMGTALLAGSIYKIIETGSLSHAGDGAVFNEAGALGAVGAIFVFDLNLGE